MTFSESVPPLMSFALGLELRSRVNQLSDAVTSLEAELEKLAIQQQPFVVTKELSVCLTVTQCLVIHHINKDTL